MCVNEFIEITINVYDDSTLEEQSGVYESLIASHISALSNINVGVFPH